MSDRLCRNVLIVSPQSQTARVLLAELAAVGIRGMVVREADKAAAAIPQPIWDLVIIESQIPGGPWGLIERSRTCYPERPLVMVGPAGDTASAVEAMRAGCWDYLAAPLEAPAARALIETCLPAGAAGQIVAGEGDASGRYQIAGVSGRFLEVVELARRVAPTSVSVLISGESGTGTELLSYLIHRESRRTRGSYIRVNCAALSESLLESELFGHERGAFTGACAQRKGRFERADGGTLLLDEISETGPRLQAELLRVLEQQDFERVGGSENIHVDVRVVSTTNRDLSSDVETGRFRRDLHYRIAGVHLQVPPLRQRVEDIPVLVWHFVHQYAAEVRRKITDIDPAMLDLFCGYHWPGNIRQLRNVVRTALIFGREGVLSLRDAGFLADELGRGQGEQVVTLRLRELERQAVMEALRRTRRNQVKAAELLGISDRTLREKLRRYRAEPQGQPSGETACQSSPT
ncbi:MAG: sigma-54 dependent transcriptional regulator [Planctomycetaceae bacterium]|nr:sigma-54 dependent transcriptional regulator [Planctomycetaceae bacterium]